jgi:hypothetical protein
VWIGRPPSLHHAARVIAAARDDGADTAVKLAAIWTLIALPLRAVLHFLSWVLGDPFRTALAAIVFIIIFLGL